MLSRSVRAAPCLRFSRLISSNAITDVPNAKMTAAEMTETTVPAVPHAEVCSGAPADLTQRTVLIFMPSPTTTQSSPHRNNLYRLEFHPESNSRTRWENPLMGWASTADTMQAVRLWFRSQDEAVYFAEKQGWSWEIVEAVEEKKVGKKEYAENFKYSPHKLKLIRTK